MKLIKKKQNMIGPRNEKKNNANGCKNRLIVNALLLILGF